MNKNETKKRIFLVDYENVKSAGLNGITGLTEEDVVCFFYSENAETMTFGLHRRLTETKANVQYQKVEVGVKNALDFQLSSYLGYVIYQNQAAGLGNVVYYIVTNDHGFSCLKTYWKKRNIEVNLAADINVGVKSAAMPKEEPKQEGKPEAPKPEGIKQEPVKKDTSKKEAPKKEDVKKDAPKKENKRPTRRKNTAKKAVVQPTDELTKSVEALLEDKTAVEFVVKCINHYKTKSGVNNALMKEFKDAKKAGQIYSAIKPLIADKKGR